MIHLDAKLPPVIHACFITRAESTGEGVLRFPFPVCLLVTGASLGGQSAKKSPHAARQIRGEYGPPRPSSSLLHPCFCSQQVAGHTVCSWLVTQRLCINHTGIWLQLVIVFYYQPVEFSQLRPSWQLKIILIWVVHVLGKMTLLKQSN